MVKTLAIAVSLFISNHFIHARELPTLTRPSFNSSRDLALKIVEKSPESAVVQYIKFQLKNMSLGRLEKNAGSFTINPLDPVISTNIFLIIDSNIPTFTKIRPHVGTCFTPPTSWNSIPVAGETGKKNGFFIAIQENEFESIGAYQLALELIRECAHQYFHLQYPLINHQAKQDSAWEKGFRCLQSIISSPFYQRFLEDSLVVIQRREPLECRGKLLEDNWAWMDHLFTFGKPDDFIDLFAIKAYGFAAVNRPTYKKQCYPSY